MFPETVRCELLESVLIVGDDEDFPTPAEALVALWAGRPQELIKSANKNK